MPRSLSARKPDSRELRRLIRDLEGDHSTALQRRRAEVLLLYSQGWNAVGIADNLSLHPNTVYAILHAFDRRGLGVITQIGRGGASPRLTADQRATILRIADQAPYELGLPHGRWSLANLRAYLIRQRVLKTISREHLRRVLKKGGIRLHRVERKLRSRDPRRPAILAQIRWICRHLPAKGILLFFDEQPIAVKAYGGRRYSSRRRLVLDSRQKTRGRFYLFVIYDAQSGRIHWAFLPGKDSHHVCQFMRRVRSWYRGAEVWVALDQDTTHPRKSKETRRMMRRLGLHWISLPKSSPDDNPVETLFRDVQLMVLDNSDDPDPRATQRRINARFRGRNRRKDRRIRIPYLDDSHKG